jgi:LysR family transcriptional regulator, glycine cleavage system transcriptional activator
VTSGGDHNETDKRPVFADNAAKLPHTVRRERLPSLRSLRTFEVVGRHLNMQTAADALCITVSAVSHQIRHLEAELQVQLFRRTGRGVELTKDGEALLPGLSLVFEQLGATIEKFRRRSGPEIVTISMSASFAMRWFLGRLSKFYETHPEIEIRVSTHVGKEVQKDATVDCFIHVGSNNWPELEGELLFAENLSVACSPSILRQLDKAIHVPSDVLKNRILCADERPDDWAIWLRATGLSLPPRQRVLAFQSYNQGAWFSLSTQAWRSQPEAIISTQWRTPIVCSR